MPPSPPLLPRRHDTPDATHSAPPPAPPTPSWAPSSTPHQWAIDVTPRASPPPHRGRTNAPRGERRQATPSPPLPHCPRNTKMRRRRRRHPHRSPMPLRSPQSGPSPRRRRPIGCPPPDARLRTPFPQPIDASHWGRPPRLASPIPLHDGRPRPPSSPGTAHIAVATMRHHPLLDGCPPAPPHPPRLLLFPLTAHDRRDTPLATRGMNTKERSHSGDRPRRGPPPVRPAGVRKGLGMQC